MIFFKPIAVDTCYVKFQALENEEKIGECLLDLSGKNADVSSLNFNSDKPYAVEGLLRAAYNYAATKNFYIATCSCKNIDSFCEKMNFSIKDGVYYSDIPSILMGSCCKN